MPKKPLGKNTVAAERGKVTFAKHLTANRPKRKDVDDLELLTVKELQQALQVANDTDLESMRAAASANDTGYVARDRESGNYTVVSDVDLVQLQKAKFSDLADILEQQTVNDSDEAPDSTLLSTQMFRKLIGIDD